MSRCPWPDLSYPCCEFLPFLSDMTELPCCPFKHEFPSFGTFLYKSEGPGGVPGANPGIIWACRFFCVAKTECPKRTEIYQTGGLGLGGCKRPGNIFRFSCLSVLKLHRNRHS